MEPQPNSPATHRTRNVYFAVTALKLLAICLAFAAGRFHPFIGDNAANLYLPIAQRMLDEGRFNGPESREDSKVPIAYPAFLAASEWFVGEKYFLIAACCAQVVGDLAVAGMIYWIGFRLTNRRAAALAGFLWLVFPPAVVMATWITAENLFTVAFIASMAVLIAGVHRRAPWLVFAAGIVLGLATMFRGTCLFLPLFLFPFWLCADVPRRVQKALGLMAGLACVVLPWMMRNRIVLHDPIPVSTGFGSAFLQGSDADFFTIEGKTANYPAAFAQADEDGIHMPPEDARESVKDNYQLRVGLDQYRLRLKTRPASFVPLAVRKALRLWYGTESGRRKQELILAVMSLLVVPLGLCRVLSWRKAFRVETLLLGGTILYFILVHWVSLPEYRYVHPIMPILILGMADGIVRLTCGRRSVAP